MTVRLRWRLAEVATRQGKNRRALAQLTGLTEDKLGIVIGAKPGMSTDTNAEFLLLMWGGATAPVSNSPQCTTGGASPVGLRLYYVSGVPTLDEFWQGTDEDAACSPLGQGLVQLAQANTLGTVGWVPNQTYNFDVRVSGCSLRVFVDGVLEFESLFDMSSVFDGQLGFACLSQRVLAGNVFSSPLPNPASLTEFGTGTMGTSSVPQLTSPSGCSVDGGQFTLRATNSSDTAAQAGVLYISPTPLDFFLPLVGGNIYVDPSFSVVIPIFAPAGGFVDQLVNLSPDPGLIGMDFAGQAGWLDPAGTANIALTNRLLTIIGA